MVRCWNWEPPFLICFLQVYLSSFRTFHIGFAIRRAVISKEVIPDLWCLYFIYPQQRLVNMIVKGRRNIKTGGCKAINYTSSKVITETGIFWIMQTLSLFFLRQEYKYQHQKYKTQTFSNGWKLGHSCDLSNIDGTNVLVVQRCFINMFEEYITVQKLS